MHPSSPRSRGPARLLRRGVMLAALGLAVAPVAAMAGTASVSGTTLSYVAAAGETNSVQITFDGVTTYTINEFGVVPVTPGAGCAPVVGDPTSATCTVVATAVNVDLGDLNDVLLAGSLTVATTVAGGPGDDSVGTGSGNDSVTLGDGDDSTGTLLGDDTIDGGAGNDNILSGGAGNDTITGGDGADFISDGDGNDTVAAGAGDDDVTAGLGTDSYSGGADTDSIGYSRSDPTTGVPIPVNVSLDGVANDGAAGENDNAQADFEDLSSGGGDDTLTGNDSENEINGGSGNDTINGLGNDDNLSGSAGNDTVNGGTGQDSVSGSDGNDTLSGNEGNDTLGTDPGSDSLSGGTGQDSVRYFGRNPVNVNLNDLADDGVAGEGDNVRTDNEILTTGSGNDTVTGSNGVNDITTGPGNDTVTGLNGNDDLEGGSGNDTLSGGGGDDNVNGGLDTDIIGGGSGVDTVSYADRIDRVVVRLDGRAGDGQAGENDLIRRDVENAIGGRFNDLLVGSSGPNELSGLGGNDVISGLGGGDYLDGGRGNDRLTGGRGNDSVTGGSGTDQFFVRDRLSDDVFCGAGNDIIRQADRTGARRDRTSPDCERGGVRP